MYDPSIVKIKWFIALLRFHIHLSQNQENIYSLVFGDIFWKIFLKRFASDGKNSLSFSLFSPNTSLLLSCLAEINVQYFMKSSWAPWLCCYRVSRGFSICQPICHLCVFHFKHTGMNLFLRRVWYSFCYPGVEACVGLKVWVWQVGVEYHWLLVGNVWKPDSQVVITLFFFPFTYFLENT